MVSPCVLSLSVFYAKVIRMKYEKFLCNLRCFVLVNGVIKTPDQFWSLFLSIICFMN